MARVKADLNFELLSLLLEHSILSLKEISVPKGSIHRRGVASTTNRNWGVSGWLEFTCICKTQHFYSSSTV